MQFSYHKDCGIDLLNIEDDSYKYLIKARRHKINDKIFFRNLNDEYLYEYELCEISKRNATLKLISKEEKNVSHSKGLHIIWSIVDPKTVEKYLASLNEIGVEKITFVYADFSQKNFKLNFEKLEKILINSSCQCGRSNIIKLEQGGTLEEFVNESNEELYFLDFSDTMMDDKKDEIKNLVIGCEGGFSEDERESAKNKVGFRTPLILRSETAIISAASKILL